VTSAHAVDGEILRSWSIELRSANRIRVETAIGLARNLER